MSPIFVSIVGGIVRTLVAAGLGYLAHKGVIASDSASITEAVTYITGIALVVLWSIWEKYGTHLKVIQAQQAADIAVSSIPSSQPKP